MTTSAESIVSAAITAYNEKHWNDLAALVSMDVVSRIGPNAPTVGPLGLLQVVAYYQKYFDVHFDSAHFIVDGDSIAFRMRLKATYHTTEPGLPEAWGQLIDVPAVGFVTLKDDVMTRLDMIFNYEDWLRATDTTRSTSKQGVKV